MMSHAAARWIATVLLLGLVAAPVVAQQKPEKTKGVEESRLQQFGVLQIAPGRDLRLRRIVFAPGGAVAEHSHSDRPGMVYVLEGSMTERRGGTARVVKAGDSWIEDAGTLHWLENNTDKPCVFLAVDLIKP
ncbi:MAG TPA: cupin domain-containing protein [Burkholderiales bacterium]|jgi:quercetin dioxygenase-like cupin family protein